MFKMPHPNEKMPKTDTERRKGTADAMLNVYRVQEGYEEPHGLAVREVSEVLTSGGLALIPTETVYGLAVAVNAFSDAVSTAVPAPAYPVDPTAAVNGAPVPALGTGYRRIFTLKRRELTQTVAWLVGGEDDLDVFGVDVPAEVHELARAFWPGALTIVVKAAPCVPTFMRAADGTVALRASASPVVRALVRACGSPLACTSANSHGAPSPAAFADVEPRVLAGVDVAVDAGVTPCRDASTIVSLVNGSLEVLRRGALPVEDIERLLA